MSPAALGMLLGAFVITGLISRILDKYAFKAQQGAKKALLVALATAVITVALGTLGLGMWAAVRNYLPMIAVWFVMDLVRARRPAGPAK